MSSLGSLAAYALLALLVFTSSCSDDSDNGQSATDTGTGNQPGVKGAHTTPEFPAMNADRIQEETRIVAGRSYAVFGFNTPEITIRLPNVPSSAYAVIEFGEPKLFSEEGTEVEYERELGLYEEEGFSKELRFKNASGDDPVTFARAVGTVKVRYPASIATLSFDKPSSEKEGIRVDIAGSQVTCPGDIGRIAEGSPFLQVPPVRAYDAKGQLLEKNPLEEWLGTERIAIRFEGAIAVVRVDTVKEWHEFDMSYELPPAPLLPESTRGIRPESD